MKVIRSFFYWFRGLFSCRAYVACKMTGRSRREMIKRAKEMVTLGKRAGIEVISPVLEEHVQGRKGKLHNTSKLRLYKKWLDDKHIICWTAHALIMDGADVKSYGMEREYGLNRFLWWKPTISILPHYDGWTIADFEDDKIFHDAEAAFHYLSVYHGNLYKRCKWRLAVLNRSFPKFLVGQLWQWIH